MRVKRTQQVASWGYRRASKGGQGTGVPISQIEAVASGGRITGGCARGPRGIRSREHGKGRGEVGRFPHASAPHRLQRADFILKVLDGLEHAF